QPKDHDLRPHVHTFGHGHHHVHGTHQHCDHHHSPGSSADRQCNGTLGWKALGDHDADAIYTLTGSTAASVNKRLLLSATAAAVQFNPGFIAAVESDLSWHRRFHPPPSDSSGTCPIYLRHQALLI